MLSFALLVIAGLLGGYLAGLVGIGGGIVYVFIIPFALKFIGVPEAEMAQYTIANSIFAIFFSSTSANYTLYKMNNFYLRPVFTIGFFSIATSLLTLQFVVNTNWYDIQKFNIVVILLLVYMLIFTLINAKNTFDSPIAKLKLIHFALVGICSGVVASISGLGGGIVIIPLLNSVFKSDIKKSSYISAGVIMLTALVMTIFNMTEQPQFAYQNYNLGYIIFPIGIALSAGIISSPYGVKTATKLSPKTISYIYATILGIVIIRKITEIFL